jgi:hypothetical protein
MKPKTKPILFFLALLGIIPLIYAVPLELDKQGIAWNATTGELLTGNHVVNVTFYKIAGDAVVFSSQQTLNFDRGIYNMIIGLNTATDFGDDLYMRMKVDGNAQLPQVNLTSSPYAIRCQEANNVTWVNVDGGQAQLVALNTSVQTAADSLDKALNVSLLAQGVLDNASSLSQADTLDKALNVTLLAKDVTQNASLIDYIGSANASCSAFADTFDKALNVTLLARDVAQNASLIDYINLANASTTYTNASGINLTANVFSLSSHHRLPIDCSDGNIAEWDNTAKEWNCGDDDVGGGGTGDKWIDDGSWISPNTTFASTVNATIFTSNWGTNITLDSVYSSNFIDEGVTLEPDDWDKALNVTLKTYADTLDKALNTTTQTYTDNANASMKAYADSVAGADGFLNINLSLFRNLSGAITLNTTYWAGTYYTISQVDSNFTNYYNIQQIIAANASAVAQANTLDKAQNASLLAKDASTNTSMRDYVNLANTSAKNYADSVAGADGFLDINLSLFRNLSGAITLNSSYWDTTYYTVTEIDTNFTKYYTTTQVDNELTGLNHSIGERGYIGLSNASSLDVAANTSVKTYTDAQDVAQNTSLLAKDVTANTSMRDYVILANTSMKNYADSVAGADGFLNINLSLFRNLSGSITLNSTYWDGTYYTITQINANFTNYYNVQQVDNELAGLNTSLKTDADTLDKALNVSAVAQANTLDQALNVTTQTYTGLANTSMKAYVDSVAAADGFWDINLSLFRNNSDAITLNSTYWDTTYYTVTEIDANFTKYYTSTQVDSEFTGLNFSIGDRGYIGVSNASSLDAAQNTSLLAKDVTANASVKLYADNTFFVNGSAGSASTFDLTDDLGFTNNRLFNSTSGCLQMTGGGEICVG